MAAKADQSKLSPQAKKALKRLNALEDGVLTLIAALPKYLREIQDVKAMFLPKEEK